MPEVTYALEVWLKEGIVLLDDIFERKQNYFHITTDKQPIIGQVMVLAGDWIFPLDNVLAVRYQEIEKAED